MLLTKQVYVTLHRNIKYYEDKGYDVESLKYLDKNKRYTMKRGTKLLVNVEDLMPGSGEEIEVLCDYCNINISTKKYFSYNLQRRYIQKDCCDDFSCRVKKLQEVMQLTQGVSNTFQLEQTKSKIKQHYLENYNVNNPNQVPEIITKRKNTLKEKYGVENPFQIEVFKEKAKETIQEKYGVDNYTQTKEYKEKTKQTCLDKYGVDNPMKNEKIKDLAIKRQLKSKYKNETGISSAQQTYLYELYGGELNYAIDRCLLDIAFPEDKIYIEYDGGGHDLLVKLGKLSKKEFETKEIKRQYYYKTKGWRLIKIISYNDLLPKDEILLNIINIGYDFFKATSRTWIYFDIDNKIIKSAEGIKEFDYGQLRKIENNKGDNNAI